MCGLQLPINLATKPHGTPNAEAHARWFNVTPPTMESSRIFVGDEKNPFSPTFDVHEKVKSMSALSFKAANLRHSTNSEESVDNVRAATDAFRS
jgi:hypothetical protein